MKHIWLTSVVFVVMGFTRKASESHALFIEVSGLSGQKGNVVVALYRPQDDFPSAQSPYKHGTATIDANSTAKFTFRELNSGKYAVAVYQDVNLNGKLDKNLIGVPLERYGFSRNARGTFSAPSFAEAAIELSQDRKITIDVK